MRAMTGTNRFADAVSAQARGNPRLMPAAASEWLGPVHSANGGSSPLVRWLSGRLRERGGILQRRLAGGPAQP